MVIWTLLIFVVPNERRYLMDLKKKAAHLLSQFLRSITGGSRFHCLSFHFEIYWKGLPRHECLNDLDCLEPMYVEWKLSSYSPHASGLTNWQLLRWTSFNTFELRFTVHTSLPYHTLQLQKAPAHHQTCSDASLVLQAFQKCPALGWPKVPTDTQGSLYIWRSD